MMRRRRLIPVLFSGGSTLDSYIKSLAPIAYWPFNELSGAAINYGSLGTAANGRYSGVMLAQVAAPGGGLAGSWDGVNDDADIYSAALAAAFSTTVNTMGLWFKHAAGTWTDATIRIIYSIGGGVQNRFNIYKSDTNNTMAGLYVGSNVADIVTTAAYATTAWHLAVTTMNKTADEFKLYIDGVLIGTASTLNTYIGALDVNYCNIGSLNSSGNWGKGNFSRAFVCGTVLTQPQIATMYALGGV